MKLSNLGTDDAIVAEMGRRLASARLAQNLTQSAVAREAGLGLSTLRRMEKGSGAPTLANFVRICQVFGFLDALDQVVPEPHTSPLAVVQQLNAGRKRARPKASKSMKQWTWGDGA